MCAYEVISEKRIIEANNLGVFYRYVNKRITSRTYVGVTDHLVKTNIFNRYFASVGIPDNDVIPQLSLIHI